IHTGERYLPVRFCVLGFFPVPKVENRTILKSIRNNGGRTVANLTLKTECELLTGFPSESRNVTRIPFTLSQPRRLTFDLLIEVESTCYMLRRVRVTNLSEDALKVHPATALSRSVSVNALKRRHRLLLVVDVLDMCFYCVEEEALVVSLAALHLQECVVRRFGNTHLTWSVSVCSLNRPRIHLRGVTTKGAGQLWPE